MKINYKANQKRRWRGKSVKMKTDQYYYHYVTDINVYSTIMSLSMMYVVHCYNNIKVRIEMMTKLKRLLPNAYNYNYNVTAVTRARGG